MTDAPEDGGRVRRKARITWAVDIQPEPVNWAWEDDGQGRIPTGSLSIAAGREGTGKSSFGIWLTARVTTGTLPGALHGVPRPVLYVAVEGSWKYTLVPRLMAAAADLSMVGRFDVVTDDDEQQLTLSLPVDNAVLRSAIEEHKVGLVVIDPLMSVISEKVDTHRERDLRTALDPLARLADETEAVILGIAHFNKATGTDAASLITGSAAFRNVPRTIFGFARDESEDGVTRVMTQVKNSLGMCDELPSLTYAIESAAVATTKGIAVTARFQFLGESDRSVHDVLRDAMRDEPAAKNDRASAEEFLRKALAAGAKRSNDVEDEAKQLGFTDSTLKRARRVVKVVAEQIHNEQTKKSEWWISLPTDTGQGVRGSEDQSPATDPLPLTTDPEDQGRGSDSGG